MTINHAKRFLACDRAINECVGGDGVGSIGHKSADTVQQSFHDAMRFLSV